MGIRRLSRVGSPLTWARLAVAGSFAWLVPVWLSRPTAGGDTPWLLDGTDVLRDCLARDTLVACGYHSQPDAFGLTTAIGPWPPLQYVPDLVATSLGATTHPTRVRVLVVLGVAAIVASVILAAVVLTRVRQDGWFWGFALVVLSGPILAYANTSWGEMLASGLLVCFVAAALLQPHPAIVAVAALAACLTKETAYPFVAALGLLGLVLARRRTGRPIRQHIAWGAVGMVCGVVVSSLFNVLRFGSIVNKNYLRDEFHTPGVLRKLEFAAGLLVSPNGGIFVFWVAAAVLVLTACVLPLAQRSLRSRPDVDVRPALVLIAVSFTLIIGLASWWTPFGWLAWGPRLSLPWILPLVLIALVAYGEPLRELVRRLLAPTWRLLVVATALVALTLPHIGYLWQPQEAIHRFFSPADRHCNGSYLQGSPRYYGCVREQMWYRRPMVLDALPGLETTGGASTAIVVTLGLLGSLMLLREDARLPGSIRRPSSTNPAATGRARR
jgi:hypothetical protein